MTKASRLRSVVSSQAKTLHPNIRSTLIDRCITIVETYQFDKDIARVTDQLRRAVEDEANLQLEAAPEDTR